VNDRKRCVLAVVSGVLAMALGSVAGAEAPKTVVEIRVQGNDTLSADAVLVNVRTRVGNNFDEKVAKADEQALLRTGRFESVVTTQTQTDKGIIVTFVVRERPVVAKVVITGNQAIKTEDLLDELPFGVSDPLNQFNVQAGKQALIAKYRSSGYPFAEITVDAEALAKQQQAVYRVVEGPKVHIRRVRYQGNSYFRTLYLRFQTKTAGRFWPLVSGNLDAEQIDEDVNTLRNLYVGEGFLDAEVGRVLEFSDNKRKATLTFTINEGPRYRVNTVTFKGNTIFSGEELAGRLRLGQGEYFKALTLRRDIKRVRDTYGELGYIEADVRANKRYLAPNAELPAWAREIDDEKIALVNLVFEIVEADQFTIGRIDVRGNDTTQERIIRRELSFFPEQIYNSIAVEESQRRLQETRLFSDVSIDPVGRDPKVRDALVTVREGDTGEFLVGVGVSTNSGVLGNISLTQRNFNLLNWPDSFKQFIRLQGFKGAGQTFRMVAEPGLEMMRFRIEWFEPRLFDKRYSLGTKVFLWTRQRDEYDETRAGAVVSVGHRFPNRWYGEIATRLEGVSLNDLDMPVAPEIFADKGSHVLLGIKATAVRDRTDSRWMPSTGDRLRISYEQVAGDHIFGRADVDYRAYRTVRVDALDRKHILAARVSGGTILGDAPVFETYYGGGIGSIRGFEYRGVSPRGTGSTDPIGGDFIVLAGLEYSFPLITDQLRGVVFLDTGTVEDSFTISSYRASIGVGFRWIIPLFGPVPMSFDFAVPISKDSTDEEQVFSFTMGVTF
jgi:outer membrane protein insertion porin family